MYLKNKSQTFLSLGHHVIASGTLSLSLAYTTLKRILLLLLLTLFLFVCLFVFSEVQNIAIRLLNALMSLFQ